MRPARFGWAGIIGAALGFDVMLIRRGHDPLTAAARHHKLVTSGFLIVFVAHLVDVLGPADPFRALSRFVVREIKE